MIIKLHHPDKTEMDIETDDIVEIFETHTKDSFYSTVYLEDYVVICTENIEEIERLIEEKNGKKL